MTRHARPAAFVIGVTLAAAVWALSAVDNRQEDLFIYRAGSALAQRGVSPYDSEALRAEVAAHYPDKPDLIANCGYFLAPQAVALFRPFALVPWEAARVAWPIVSFGVLLAGLWLLPGGRWWLPLVVLADPLLALASSLGQTSILMAGLLLCGYGLARRGRPVAAGLAWSLLFMKPHLALPLAPLALLFDRRMAAALAAGVVAGTLLGLALGPDPLAVPGDYLRHLSEGHRLVSYNRVAVNPQLTSWNSALLALGGPLIELGVGGTLAGYAAVGAAAACRRGMPAREWRLAVGVAAAPVCCQAWAYELVLLAGLLPLAAGGRFTRGRLVLFAALWILKSVPVEAGNAAADLLGGRLGQVAVAYRSFAALGLLAVALTASPPAACSGRPRR